MKSLILFLLASTCSCFTTGLSAQLSLPLKFSSNVKPSIEKVLSSYADHYASIMGDTLSVSPTEIVYSSTVKPEGAETGTITEFLNSGQHDFAWQVVIFRSEDFSAAAKKYHSCCQQIKNLSFRCAGVASKLQGSFEAPGDTKNFYSSVFAPASSDPLVEKIRVEVLLQSDVTGWLLSIQVYDIVHTDREGSIN